MKALVVIPGVKTNYEVGFSAPLAWLFSKHINHVTGIYSSNLNRETVRAFDTFIVELNWFTELYEFSLIVHAIKSLNPRARILFGGLFASIMPETIFRHYDVDFFIQGDNELPMQLFLDDCPPLEIPNFVGRNFQSRKRYIFTSKDFETLEYNIDWFPEYLKRRSEPSATESVIRYALPMIITTKSGCSCIHEGCDYCMGAQVDVIRKIYGRPPLVMTDLNLKNAIAQVSRKYKDYSIYINSQYQYAFDGCRYDGVAHVEIDSRISLHEIQSLFSCFGKCDLHLPIYTEGVMGNSIINEYQAMLELQDEDHSILFHAYTYHRDQFKGIPDKNVKYNLDTAFSPGWANWKTYSLYDMALLNSKKLYEHAVQNRFECFVPDQLLKTG